MPTKISQRNARGLLRALEIILEAIASKDLGNVEIEYAKIQVWRVKAETTE